MKTCIKFLLKIQTQLSNHFGLSGNIEKYFWFEFMDTFLWVFILIMRDYGEFFEIFRDAFLKKVGII